MRRQLQEAMVKFLGKFYQKQSTVVKIKLLNKIYIDKKPLPRS